MSTSPRSLLPICSWLLLALPPAHAQGTGPAPGPIAAEVGSTQQTGTGGAGTNTVPETKEPERPREKALESARSNGWVGGGRWRGEDGVQAEGELLEPVGPPGRGAYAVTEAGAHQRRWGKVTEAIRSDGTVAARTNSYTELASGLNRRDEQGRWVPAEARFELIDGKAVARLTAHQVILAEPTSERPVTLLTPDGIRLVSRVIGIGYFSAASGRSTLIAEVRPAQGQLVATNVVLFPDCFDGGWRADLRYVLSLNGLEQDIIFREQLPPPAAVGLEGEDVRIELLTEFLEAPQPVQRPFVLRAEKRAEVRAQMAEPDFTDELLRFGTMIMPHGRAFDLAEGTRNPRAGVPTGKRWQVIEGRNVLFEAIELEQALPFLSKLPARPQASVQPKSKPRLVASRSELLPTRKPPTPSSPVVLAQAEARTPGFVLDYSILSSGNVVIEGGSTCLVTGGLSIDDLTLYGGACIKLLDSTEAALGIYGRVNCLTSPWNPSVVTSSDDDSVGERIDGSSGTPSTSDNDGIVITQNPWFAALHDLRVLYRRVGIYFFQASGEVKHCQVLHSGGGVYAQYTGSVACRNVLLYDSGSAFGAYSGSLTGENITVHQASVLLAESDGALALTNSLVIAVEDLSGYAGSFNLTNGIPAEVFQSVGRGDHYLAAGSPYRDAGTTSIDPVLLRDLRQRTTYPPVVLANDFTTDTVLFPQAARDTGVPDLGFHPDPIDFCVSGLKVSNAQLLLTNGVVVATYGSSGLVLQSGATLVSEGSPLQPNRLIRYSSVQEQPTIWGGTNVSLIQVASGLATLPSVDLRFTHLPILAAPSGEAFLIRNESSNKVSSFSMKDCQLQNIGLAFRPSSDTRSSTVTLTNNLFERCELDLAQLSAANSPLGVNLKNNLLLLSYVTLEDETNNAAWNVFHNLFDSCIPSFATNHISNGTNAYYSTTALAGSTGGDIVLASAPDYQGGPLGRYYYPATGTNLAQLIDAGGEYADDAGFYHYTTRIDQEIEGTGLLDIGMHYVAVGPPPSLADGLVGYWRLNDGAGATATDSSGNGNDGTLHGGTWYPGPAPRDGNIWFTASTNYIAIGDPGSGVLDFGTGSFSYGMWLYLDGIFAGGWNWPWYKGGYGGSDAGYDMELSATEWYADVSDGSSDYWVTLDQGIFGRWVHFFAVVDRAANQMRLYVDGVLTSTADITGLGSVSNSTAASIGRSVRSINGNIDDVRIYNRALLGGEIALLALPSSLDGDNDGIADYLEDRNGDGLVNSGETDWESASDPGLSVFIGEPKEHSNIP